MSAFFAGVAVEKGLEETRRGAKGCGLQLRKHRRKVYQARFRRRGQDLKCTNHRQMPLCRDSATVALVDQDSVGANFFS